MLKKKSTMEVLVLRYLSNSIHFRSRHYYQRLKEMKSLFYFSQYAKDALVNCHLIDGIEFTEHLTVQDDEDPKPLSVWPDLKLVAIIENVTTLTSDPRFVDYEKLLLLGRIVHQYFNKLK